VLNQLRFIRLKRAPGLKKRGPAVSVGSCSKTSSRRNQHVHEFVVSRHGDSWLEQGASHAEVADWLNEHSVPVGPYSRGNRWTAEMVSRISQNPILKGVRIRNRKLAKRVNSTGRRKVIDAPPEELLERNCPHLVFIEPARFDRLQRVLQQRNAVHSRVKNGVAY
jgi:site-specific DNA recombinase